MTDIVIQQHKPTPIDEEGTYICPRCGLRSWNVGIFEKKGKYPGKTYRYWRFRHRIDHRRGSRHKGTKPTHYWPVNKPFPEVKR